ncbi:hypothetical protein TWF506_003014 [Arthrobotrys conoides]|uniref:Protein kinase domain-containing protein n=1 Tax=Arthrobotrys conoides TaxID=74498 RepID=A0AAN8P6S8_9PEZI
MEPNSAEPLKLRERIGFWRRSNVNGQAFVLTGPLLDEIDLETITSILHQCNFQSYAIREAAQTILQGGKLALSILIDISRPYLIGCFIKSDNLLDTTIDSRIPYSESHLQRLIPDENDYHEFYKKQWEFVAPVFKPSLQFRELPVKTILPFLSYEVLGEGSFGKVYKARLPVRHQSIIRDSADECISVAVKEVEEGYSYFYEQEKHILSLLRSLRSPNIVQFFTAYTFNRKLYFLFELASSNLKTFLACQRALPPWTDEAIFNALYGLSLALHDVHNYSFREDNLQLIGCHYDLKPDNILIKDGKFLLADFGLSRLKFHEEGSKSNFKFGTHDYLAPECQSMEDFQKNPIGRASDMWSFGCIILEIATYLLLGPDGVNQFAEQRTIRMAFLTIRMFHAGQGESNQKVIQWIQKLEDINQSRYGNQENIRGWLLELVRDMLNTSPTERPTASQASARIFYLLQKILYNSISELLSKLAAISGSTEILIERERFRLWGDVTNLNGPGPVDRYSGSWLQGKDAILHRGSIHSLLQGIQTELFEISQILDNQSPEVYNRPLYYKLSTMIDGLWDMQSHDIKQEMNTALESKLLTDLNLEAIEKADLGDNNGHRRLRMLAAMKEVMVAILDFPDRNKGLVKREELTIFYKKKQANASFIPGILKLENTRKALPVIIELLKYEDKYITRQQDLFKRVEDLVFLLGQPTTCKMLPILQCRNFAHLPQRQSLALIYEIPTLESGEDTEPNYLTLHSIMQNTDAREERPTLGALFKLAHTLAKAILDAQTAGWVHKNISSHNILFLQRPNESCRDIFKRPYLLGFSYSRENSDTVLTTGPQSSTQTDYQSLVYLNGSSTKGSHYRQEFDYYSLGLVLLEIGLWDTLSEIRNESEDGTPEQIQQLFRTKIPLLDSYMGELYKNAVLFCITSDFPKEEIDDTNLKAKIRDIFRKRVVNPLQRCLAINIEED